MNGQRVQLVVNTSACYGSTLAVDCAEARGCGEEYPWYGCPLCREWVKSSVVADAVNKKGQGVQPVVNSTACYGATLAVACAGGRGCREEDTWKVLW